MMSEAVVHTQFEYDSLRLPYPILTERAAKLERHAKNRALEACTQALDELKSTCGRVVA